MNTKLVEKKSILYVYQPSTFWNDAVKKIESYIRKNGIRRFRSDNTNLAFFVPTYGSPGNGFSCDFIAKVLSNVELNLNSKQRIFLKNKFSGFDHALSDYRAFKISNSDQDPLGLLKFSESKIGSPIEHFNFEEKWFSRSSLNYLLGLTFLLSVAPNFKPRKILEIGGGFGSLAEILAKSSLTEYKYLGFDFPVMSKIAKNYLSNCLKNMKPNSITEKLPVENFTFDDLSQFSFLPNWKIEDLQGSIDLFINFISFQEMEPEIVSNYISHIQRLKPEWVLLRNMREGKQVAENKKVGVKKQILTKDYLTFFSKYKLVKSSVLEYGFETVDGFNSELLVLKKK